jgi:prefoldin subunit 5
VASANDRAARGAEDLAAQRQVLAALGDRSGAVENRLAELGEAVATLSAQARQHQTRSARAMIEQRQASDVLRRSVERLSGRVLATDSALLARMDQLQALLHTMERRVSSLETALKEVQPAPAPASPGAKEPPSDPPGKPVPI